MRNLKLKEIDSYFVPSQVKLAAHVYVSLGCRYWGIEDPEVRYFSAAGDGAAIHVEAIPFASPPQLWLRSDLDYREARRVALHEVYHHAVAQLRVPSKDDAVEELEADYFAKHFMQLRREAGYRPAF